MNINTKYNILFPIARFILVLLVLSSCSVTRYVPEDKYLLSDNKIEVIGTDRIDESEIENYLRQTENLKILGVFKFHLWLYNLSRIKKERGWLKKIGEEPVIYDRGLKDKSVQQLTQFMYNKGYYTASITDTVIYKKKKANVVYTIVSGEPYLIRKIGFQIKDNRVAELVNESIDNALFKADDILDVDVLEKERTRISNHLKNNGFYKFADEFIHYKIDTAFAVRKADIEVIIENPVDREGNFVPHKVYKVKDYSLYIDKPEGSEIGDIYKDTIKGDGYTFMFNNKMTLKENLFYKTLELKPGDQYTKRLEEKTYNNLYALSQFKYVNIKYRDENIVGDSLNGWLRGKVFLPIQTKQNYSIDIEGTNKSGNLGIAGNINYQHRNLLGGAEIFDIKLKGARERQVTKDGSLFNTQEFGTEVKLTVPGLLLPIKQDRIELYSIPFTVYSLAWSYQNRPDYTRTIVNAKFGYSWRSNQKYSHHLNLLDLNAVRIPVYDEEYIQNIDNAYVASAFEDHIISATSYNLVYNDQSTSKQANYHYFRFGVESAGNSLQAFSRLTQREQFVDSDYPDSSPYYKYFDTRFAQYLKGDFDFRYGYRIDKYNSVATRLFAGIAFPYGNFNVVPLERRYFTGGANGIRAWQVRTLGPGAYSDELATIPNQLSDIKLEANIEYRFHLFWMVEGAVFADAGNIWAINNSEYGEESVFKFDRFYKEIALGTGLGLRLVSSYFIIRGDLGFKLRDPSLPEGKRFIHLYNPITMDDFAFNIAIGYPF